MAKRQRTLKEATDRVMMTCTEEMGQRIRRLADKKGVTISRFLAEIVEAHLDEVSTFFEEKENNQ